MSVILLNHFDFNEVFEGKAKWELHKNAAYWFEQILEATFYMGAFLRPVNSNFITSKMSGETCWVQIQKISQINVQNYIINTPVLADHEKTYIHNLYVIQSICHENDGTDDVTDLKESELSPSLDDNTYYTLWQVPLSSG